jgi:CRISPR-associated protein Csb1
MSEIPEAQIKNAEDLLDNLLGVEARRPGGAAKLPAAIRVVESLAPAGGMSVPVFPASYLGDGDKPVYDLNGVEFGEATETIRSKDRERVVRPIVRAKLCALDSPQAQANRMEPAFVDDPELRALVPQAMATIPRAPEKEGSEHVLRLPHRVADFRIRLSNQKDTVKAAVSSFAKGNALPLLKILPTSVLFGFWDSRDSQTKHARILLGRIDAFDVVPCQRHALYNGPYSKDEFATVVLGDPARAAVKKDADKMAEQGYSNAPSDGLGGVIVQGRIERLALLSLTDIARVTCIVENEEKPNALTNAARRYLFALAGLAEGYARSTGSHRLRSGCELVADGENSVTIDLRGGSKDYSGAQGVKQLFVNRALLIILANRAREVLLIPSKLDDFLITNDDLKADFGEAPTVGTPTGTPVGSTPERTANKGRTKKS